MGASSKLNRRGLAEAIAGMTGHDHEQVDEVLKAATLVIKKCVADGGTVTIADFGTWRLGHRKARMHQVPTTGAPVPKPEHWKPVWTPGKGFRTATRAYGS
ncbi:HU family DNA-binding protein [Spongiactinospora sp. TRM90649]|uniref:HU family DNA-binding protein n=1 Tax=Spongiactinospora sp. TRM90649 TaxID=3031114 RepID=UPI0023F94888|nr:HU family DNA-binding protein [Spongiactinospora sp. TRM90649]MDF5756567.1 HU family DNA-binding protein [Spongiactinospora sp. TRM90649]